MRVEAGMAQLIQHWLDAGECIPDVKETAVLQSYTEDLGDGYQADIKVCNGDTGPWIDAVLFKDGHEVQVLEPSFHFLGSYEFQDGDLKFVVAVDTDYICPHGVRGPCNACDVAGDLAYDAAREDSRKDF